MKEISVCILDPVAQLRKNVSVVGMCLVSKAAGDVLILYEYNWVGKEYCPRFANQIEYTA